MRRTNLYLDDRQTTALDRIARAQGLSRAEVMRRMMERGLAAHPADLDGDLASIESSFGVLADAVTPPPRPGSASCAPRRRPPPVILGRRRRPHRAFAGIDAARPAEWRPVRCTWRKSWV